MYKCRITSFLLTLSLLLAFILCSYYSFAQGIQFTGSDQPIEKRTSAAFFIDGAPSFNKRFMLHFDLQLPNNGTIGYIVRLKEQHQDAIYNLYYDEEDGNAVFLLNEEGKSSLITMRIPLDELKDKHWFPVQISCDLQADSISLQVADQPKRSVSISLPATYSPQVIFGRSDYMIDVPSISLRNVRIGNTEKEIIFPLRESEGHKLHNATGEVMGEVTNGIWLLNNAFHWQRRLSLSSSSPAGSAYDAKRKSIYYFNHDSLQIYQLQTNEVRTVRFQHPCPMKLKLGNNFIHPEEDRLYVYETFHAGPYTGPTVVSLDLHDFTWRVESADYLHQELNHHAAYYLSKANKLLLFGGFGNMTYSNALRYYDLTKKNWSPPVNLQGDLVMPRYFTTIGQSIADQQFYFFGGMGNESGQHIVGRKYFYDLYTLDPVTARAKKLWDLDWKEELFVPGRGLIIPDTSWVYMLGYPEHLTHSHIKLYRFALRNGAHEILGDSIPIYSDKISTHAQLNFDPHLKQLIALVQESDDDIRSTLTIYTIDFPAINEAQLHAFPNIYKPQSTLLPYALAIIVFLLGILLYIQYDRRRRKLAPKPEILPHTPDLAEQVPVNRIYLFGDFTALDKQGTDISHLFSSRLQQVFCLITYHSQSVGISSKLLSHTLWPDKPKDKVKTSRGVAINNLRKVLHDLDGVEIIYEEGHYRIAFDTACYCDYWELKKMFHNGEHVLSEEVTTILKRGQFLLGLDDPLFDEIKQDMENTLSTAFQQAMDSSRERKDWGTLFHIASLFLSVDPLHDPALENGLYAIHKGNLSHDPADFYQRFAEKYERLMGTAYPYSFTEMWKHEL